MLMIALFELPVPAPASISRIWFSASPPMAAPPTCKKPRREMPSQKPDALIGRPRMVSMSVVLIKPVLIASVSYQVCLTAKIPDLQRPYFDACGLGPNGRVGGSKLMIVWPDSIQTRTTLSWPPAAMTFPSPLVRTLYMKSAGPP